MRNGCYVVIEKPKEIPCIVEVFTSSNVARMRLLKAEDNEHLCFSVESAYSENLIDGFKLVLSYEEKPELNFPYSRVGLIELGGKKVFLLLEKKNVVSE